MRSYKVELKPNNKQKTYFEQCFGIARKAYNWGLNLCMERHKEGLPYLGAINLHKEICKLKQSEFNYMYGVSKLVPQNSLRDLDKAFQNFFRTCKTKGKRKVGYPKFKSKHVSKQAFRIDGANIKVEFNRIKLPIIGWIKLKEYNYIPVENIKYINATIKKEGERYYVAVVVQPEHEFMQNLEIEEIIGIDLGIKTLMTISNGEIIKNPKYLKKYEKKLKRNQRKLSRRTKGSNNKKKQQKVVKKIHTKIKNSRMDYIHKATTTITKAKCRVIGLEDLNVSGMVKNHKLAKAITDSCFSEIKRQFEYKTKFYGGGIILVDRFFPSSKICSDCGCIKEELSLSDRIFVCNECGLGIDRDLNAAINIQNKVKIPGVTRKLTPIERI